MSGPVIEDEERPAVNRVVHDFWTSRGTMIAVACFFIALIMIFAAMLSLQSHDYRRTSEAGLSRAVEQMRSEIRSLRAADEKSTEDRRQIKKEVQEVRESVQQ